MTSISDLDITGLLEKPLTHEQAMAIALAQHNQRGKVPNFYPVPDGKGYVFRNEEVKLEFHKVFEGVVVVYHKCNLPKMQRRMEGRTGRVD